MTNKTNRPTAAQIIAANVRRNTYDLRSRDINTGATKIASPNVSDSIDYARIACERYNRCNLNEAIEYVITDRNGNIVH